MSAARRKGIEKMISAFYIDFQLPSLNEYIEWCRANRFQAAKHKKDVECAIMCEMRGIPPVNEPCVIHFTWYERTRRRDKDNVAFAKKFILDALQKAGKLPNDNNRYIAGFTDSFIYGTGGAGVAVEIMEAGNDKR